MMLLTQIDGTANKDGAYHNESRPSTIHWYMPVTARQRPCFVDLKLTVSN